MKWSEMTSPDKIMKVFRGVFALAALVLISLDEYGIFGNGGAFGL